MATAKRRINSTNRKRIGQDAVDIRLLDTEAGKPPRATASLELAQFGFPPTAGVAVEAYRSSSMMRFDCGTIADLRVPEIMVLDEIDAGGNIQFRVKVVDREEAVGRLLGSAQRITPRSSDDDEKGRRSLLPVRYVDLGVEIWSVVASEDEPPALLLNFRASGLENRLFTDPLVRGLLMPAAFRIVLERLVALPPPDDDDPSDWKGEWLRFCEEELEIEGNPHDSDDEAKAAWIIQAVETFASRADILGKIRAGSEGDR